MRITKETTAPAQSTIFPPETVAPSTEQGEETGTALALIGTQPAALIYAPGVLARLVERIKSEVRSELATLDVSRPKDKARIITLAALVASAKVSLDDAGKTLGEEARKQIDAINADRKWMRDELDPFKIEVRKPVTDLENAEKERVAEHEAALAEISGAAVFTADNWQRLGSEAIRDRIAEIEKDERDWQEFFVRAEGTKAITIKSMRGVLALAEAAEEGARIAEIQRAEAAERAIKEREEAAALAAKQEAERKADEQARLAREATQREEKRLEDERNQAEARAKQAEAQRVAAEEKAARDLIEAEERRKREAEQAEARRKADAEAATRREVEAAAQAKRDQDAAIEHERQKVAAEKRHELEEAEKRAKNRAHLAAVNREVLAAMVKVGASDELGKALIAAIVKGEIPRVTIAY